MSPIRVPGMVRLVSRRHDVSLFVMQTLESAEVHGATFLGTIVRLCAGPVQPRFLVQ